MAVRPPGSGGGWLHGQKCQYNGSSYWLCGLGRSIHPSEPQQNGSVNTGRGAESVNDVQHPMSSAEGQAIPIPLFSWDIGCSHQVASVPRIRLGGSLSCKASERRGRQTCNRAQGVGVHSEFRNQYLLLTQLVKKKWGLHKDCARDTAYMHSGRWWVFILAGKSTCITVTGRPACYEKEQPARTLYQVYKKGRRL